MFIIGAPLNLINRKFGRVEVVEEIESRYTPSGCKIRRWRCKCDCGNIFKTSTHNLTSGDTKSCGCYAKESRINNSTIHGDHGTKLHNIWCAMRRRCRDSKNKDYKYYGAKNIKVCDEWNNSYLEFKRWAVDNNYSDGLTIDRIDVNGNYSPDNCRWVSMKTQCNNRTSNIVYEYNGESHTISEWAERYGIKYTTLYNRLRKTNDIAQALNQNNHNSNN